MARRKPTATISPSQLKHFAAATGALVCLLAMFAAGDDSGLSARINERQARNDLIAAEQEKLGTRKIETSLRVPTTGSFGEDAGAGADNGFGGGSSQALPPATQVAAKDSARLPPFLPPAGMPKRPGGTLSRQTQKPGPDDTIEGGSGASGSGAELSQDAPTADRSQLEAAIEASRARSGSADANGD